jgi:Stigma-specific protein, Stig1
MARDARRLTEVSLRLFNSAFLLGLGLASCSACGGRATQAEHVSASAGSQSAACSLPGETCAGGCIAKGGQCLAGDIPCTGQVSTLSCGESAALGLYCCLPSIPIEAAPLGGPDGATLDDGAPKAGPDASEASAAESCGGTWCSGVCTDLTADPGHCGSCTNVCTPREFCDNGTCRGTT